jgi:hypothetical protein
VVNIDNPAGRLYTIFVKFRDHNDKTNIGDAWANVFGIDKYDTSEILLSISEVVTLIEETKYQLSLLDVNHELYMRPFGEIQQVLTFSFNQTLGHVRNYVSESVMSDLEFCDELLSREIGEKLIEEATLDDLLSNVNTLSEEIYKSDLPSELKNSIMDNLNNISWAIRHYQIHGAKGLKKATESALGSIAFFARYEHERPDEEGEQLIIKYGKFLLKVMSAVADAYALAQLTDGAVDALLPLLQ